MWEGETPTRNSSLVQHEVLSLNPDQWHVDRMSGHTDFNGTKIKYVSIWRLLFS